MKFLFTAALLVACLGSANAQDGFPGLDPKYQEASEAVKSTLVAVVQPSDIVMCKDKVFCKIRRAGGFDFLIPRGTQDQVADTAHRRARALELSQTHRHLTGVKFVSPLKGHKFAKAAKFELTGVPANSKDHTLILTDAAGVSSSFVITDPMDEGGLGVDVTDGQLEIALNPAGDVYGTFTFSFTYTVDGVLQKVAGTSIQFMPPIVRRSGGSTLVGEASYPYHGQIQSSSGRIFFNSAGTDYECTGTAITDNKTGRSIVLTAAHCVFDDIDWVFGTNVIFIPNRDDVVVAPGEDPEDIGRQCEADVCGCWYLSGGVVHDKWPDTDWPDRLAYDYGFYIVDDVGAHDGPLCRGTDALDVAVDEMDFTVGIDFLGDLVTGLGYSQDYNPDFRYCVDYATLEEPTTGVDTYWLAGCGLSGGASGGPWLVDFDSTTGKGKLVSVNSWSYSDVPGMGGPIIDESEARCLMNAAREIDYKELFDRPVGEQGEFINCYDRPCITPEEAAGRKLRGQGFEGRELCEV